MQHQNHSEYWMARSLLRSPCTGWFERCRESRFTSPRVPRQGSSPAYFRLEAASPSKRRSQGLSCVIGNFHAQFLEGWTGAIPSGYSVNFHVRFLEGWRPVMASGYSAFRCFGTSSAGLSAHFGPAKTCVKKTRMRHAVREMMVGPSKLLCRGRFQTALSCCGPRTAVVNVKEKARPMDRVMWGVGRRA